MHTVYRLNANDLNVQFIESLQAIFKDKDIEIVVSEADETAYLLHSDANREHLLQAIQRVNNQQNLVRVDLDALQ